MIKKWLYLQCRDCSMTGIVKKEWFCFQTFSKLIPVCCNESPNQCNPSISWYIFVADNNLIVRLGIIADFSTGQSG